MLQFFFRRSLTGATAGGGEADDNLFWRILAAGPGDGLEASDFPFVTTMTFCSQFVSLRQHHLNTEHDDNFADHSDTRRPPRPWRCHSNPLLCHRRHWWSVKRLSPRASSLVLHFFSFPRAALIKGAVRSPAQRGCSSTGRKKRSRRLPLVCQVDN